MIRTEPNETRFTTDRRRRQAAMLPLALALVASLAVPAAATAEPAEAVSPNAEPLLTLPEPTGGHLVGSTSLHLVDESRSDYWRPEEDRELMVGLWYPAIAPTSKRAEYTSAAVSERIVAGHGVDAPGDSLTRVETHSFRDAIPRPARGGRPLVLLSPGAGLSRESLTSLAEELASRGNIVATMDHKYEAQGIEFPDGRVTGCLLCEEKTSRELGAAMAEGRSADASFVIDELTGRDPAWWAGMLIDESRIAMAGHSLGGATAYLAMATDNRIDAGVNMDGTIFTTVAGEGLDRPFMLFGGLPHDRPVDHEDYDETWAREWAHLEGWRRWIQVCNADHMGFTDIPLLAEAFDIPPTQTPQCAADEVGLPTGERSVEITRAYLSEFVDHHLAGKESDLLDAPAPDFPEVEFRG
ncbi:alpha/beta hydrolase family protein [Actinoalloteichus hymeniacidonis]|uniref:alpha/beta hydrolase family protein n=1 Tax=Actinoalloteichus hymeniacidonis TaxID=340345 RepID=UPI000A00FDFC|nr:hypothetical protein [Actinoalloteichus hymeniacidonis]MBB5911118.1 putative dienelactone hydrolase [Actinoalloteichus hymeniacidonis]